MKRKVRLKVLLRAAACLAAALASVALAGPDLDAPVTVESREWGASWVVYPDTRVPDLYHRFPRLFGIQRDSKGRPLIAARHDDEGRYEVVLTWGVDEDGSEVRALLEALRGATSPRARLTTLTPSDARLDLAPELSESFDARVDGAGDLGSLLPGTKRALRIAVPSTFEEEFKAVLSRGDGFAGSLSLTFRWTDDVHGERVRSFATTLWLGDLRGCSLSPHSPCP